MTRAELEGLRRQLTVTQLELGHAHEELRWVASTDYPKARILTHVRNYLKEYDRLYEDPK